MLILKTVPGYPCTRTGKFGMFDKSCTRASLTLPKFAGPQRLTLGPRASMPLPGGLAQDGLPLHSACLDEHEVPKIAMAISGRARTTARKEPARTAPLPPMSPLAARPRRRRRTDLRVRLAPRSSRRGAAAPLVHERCHCTASPATSRQRRRRPSPLRSQPKTAREAAERRTGPAARSETSPAGTSACHLNTWGGKKKG